MEIPYVSQDAQNEVDLQLWLCRPNAGAASSYRYRIQDAFNIQVSYGDGSEHNTLTFSTFKDNPFVEQLSEDGWDWEVCVRWWDPRRGALVEPPGSRFVIMRSKENIVDRANRIDYILPAKTKMLEKVATRVTRYVNYVAQLNADYDRAKKAYEEAERDYNSVLRQFQNTGKRIQEEHWPNDYHGPVFAARGMGWLIRDGHARYRSLVHATSWTHPIYWYSFQQQGWVRLSMTSGSAAAHNAKERFAQLGPEVYQTRQIMNKARSAYAAAERAARESSRNGTRFFYNRTPARVISTLWREGQERDGGFLGHNDGTGTWDSPFPIYNRILKGIWRDFTATADARGRRWTRSTPRQNWEVRLGQSLWAVIQDFRERGLIDLRMGGPALGGGGRSLQLVPYGSLEVDQTRRVTLRLDSNTLEGIEEIDASEHQSITFVLTSKGWNHYLNYGREREENQTPWGMWEGAIQESEADSLTTARELTSARRSELSRRYATTSSRKVQVWAGGPIPMLDYEPHHIIGVSDHQGATSPRKVTRITVGKQDAKSPITAVVQLGTRRYRNMVSYARTLSKVVGESDVIQGHIPVDPQLEATEIPQDALYAPAITDMGVAVRINEDGRARAVVRANLASHDLPVPDDAAEFDESPEADDYIIDEEHEGE